MGITLEVIPIFDSSRLHGLDVSAKNYRIEHEFYIDVVLRHRWYHGNRNRDEVSLAQAGSSFIGNVENVDREACLNKLIAARNRFEQKSPTGARYKLHRLSREAGLPYLSWGENCQNCVDSSVRAPREEGLPNRPYWRVRISSEMHKEIETLQSLYERAGRSFDDGPPPSKDASRRTARRDRTHPSSAESGLPDVSREWIPPPLDEVTRP